MVSHVIYCEVSEHRSSTSPIVEPATAALKYTTLTFWDTGIITKDKSLL